jgi:acetylornithine deacetylase
MYGRGSCDDKGPLAAMMHAMAEIASQASPPDCEVWMLASVDEEYGFNGIKRFVEEFTADAAIVAEATQLRQVTAAKGCIFGSFVVDGRAAHGSVPQLGVNAINATAKIILAIAKDNQRLADSPHPLLGAGTCNVGVVAGGVQANIVAEQCRVEFDRRLVPGETADELLRCYNRLAQESQGLTSGLTIRFEPPRLSLVPWETPVSAPLVVAATQALKQLGLNAQPLGVPYCSHANVLAAGGIPSIILGPGSIEQAHAAVEFVDCQQLEQSVAIYREIIRNF